MTALELVSGKQIWRDCSHQVRVSMGISPDKRQLYATQMNDSVISVSTTGNQFQLNWSPNTGFGYEHIPCGVLALTNQLYTGTREGVVISIDPLSKKINWRHKVGKSAINKLVWDGKI